MFRFTLKAGIASSAIYFLNKEGIWKESQESLKVYDKLNATLAPYVKGISDQIPITLPEISTADRTSHVISQYWNKGVISTCEFLSELPDNASKWVNNGLSTLLATEEVQQLLQASDSRSSSNITK